MIAGFEAWLADVPWVTVLTLLVDLTIKSAFICAVAAIATLLLRRSTAYVRSAVWVCALVGLLARVSERFEWGPEFLAALPLGGRDGTLEDRLNGEAIPLRAKTGHLRRVASLSGYVETLDGRRLAFAVLINGARSSALDVDAALDRFVTRLSQLDKHPPAEPPPPDATALSPRGSD